MVAGLLSFVQKGSGANHTYVERGKISTNLSGQSMISMLLTLNRKSF